MKRGRATTFVLPCWLVRHDVAVVVRAAAEFTRIFARERGFTGHGPLRWTAADEVIVFCRDEVLR